MMIQGERAALHRIANFQELIGFGDDMSGAQHFHFDAKQGLLVHFGIDFYTQRVSETALDKPLEAWDEDVRQNELFDIYATPVNRQSFEFLHRLARQLVAAGGRKVNGVTVDHCTYAKHVRALCVSGCVGTSMEIFMPDEFA